MIKGVWDYTKIVEDGRVNYTTWRKTPSQTIPITHWFDLSMSPGNPGPQYYAASPLAAQQMKKSLDGGLNHGPNVPGYSKYLKRFSMSIGASTGLPMPYCLMDYLLFYPFIDMGTTDEQVMDNTQILPRYESGLGVQMMCVSVAAGTSLSPTFTVNYTNSNGISGRTSKLVTLSSATANGCILSNHHGLNTVVGNGPFIGLQNGDYGVRSIESVTFQTNDVGLIAICLVKPLLTGNIYEQAAFTETELLPHKSALPRIYDDAFLGLACCPRTAASGITYTGELETIWNY